jgi:hypothetical protein
MEEKELTLKEALINLNKKEFIVDMSDDDEPLFRSMIYDEDLKAFIANSSKEFN